jgi:hypothetical protein
MVTCRVLVPRCVHCAEPEYRHRDHRHVEPCPFGDCGPDGYLADDCGAPIPRLVCRTQGCGHSWAHHDGHTIGIGEPPRTHCTRCYCKAFDGPLASECTRGHPVAVPSEAERRG